MPGRLLCVRLCLIYRPQPRARRGVRLVLLAQMVDCPIPALGLLAERRSGHRGAPLECPEVPRFLRRRRGSLRRVPLVGVPAGSLLPLTAFRWCVQPLVPAHVGSPAWQSMGCSLIALSYRLLWAWFDAQLGAYLALLSLFAPLVTFALVPFVLHDCKIILLRDA